MKRRVVVVTRGGVQVARMLARLDARGARPAAVLVYVDGPARTGAPGAIRRALRWARRRLRAWRAARELRGAATVSVTGPLNGARMVRDLRSLAPDVLLLAGCGVVGDEILAVPREGTVNVHPALLPWIRGNGPVENSVLRAVPPGCTAHRVDAGIDTGPIISRRLVRLAGGETLGDLRRAAGALWVEMAAEIAAAAAAGPLPAGTPQHERHPLCRAVTDPAALAAAEAAAAAGAPKIVFDRWAARCDPGDLSLAPDALAPGPTDLHPAGTPAR
ncbi:formyltransferase family protein [Longimicrobium sp.]|uniref:formyltransferase family protein n=1 Tax=Longimicrobium sp. TaxID=2029185 RepID=UPI002BDDCD32|nr:formyltransferase family protein [Longimicrobium sp.]HSU12792.1 formyltransferase family protein [Longimicrobium sp.]